MATVTGKTRHLRKLDIPGVVRWLKENKLGNADIFDQLYNLDSYQKLVRMLTMLAKPEAPIVAQTIGGKILAWGDGSMIRYQYKGTTSARQFKPLSTPVVVALFHAIAENSVQSKKASFFEDQCCQAGLLKE